MGTRYAGRHRPAASATDVRATSSVRPTSDATRATTDVRARSDVRTAQRGKHHMKVPAKMVRRPVLSTGAALALVGASAAGYAKAGDAMSSSAATFTVPAAAVSQANERNNEQLEQDAYRAKANGALNLKKSAVADALNLKKSAAAEAVKAAAAAEATRLATERQAAADRAAREMQRQAIVANAQQDPRSVARMMLGDFGWGDGQWNCLERLWVGESGWNYKASNSSSGAYGIPQSLPASKMGSVAADYRTNPVTQITWGMQYIKSSYGTPCGALGSWDSRSPHWY